MMIEILTRACCISDFSITIISIITSTMISIITIITSDSFGHYLDSLRICGYIFSLKLCILGELRSASEVCRLRK